jgi:hypothetical protein
MIVLYIDSYRKIFEKNLGSINQDLIHHIVSQTSATKAIKSYINEYCIALKDGFKHQANNMIAVKIEHMILFEIDLKNYDHHNDKEFSETNMAFLKTASDMSPLGKALGKSYIASSLDTNEYNQIIANFNNMQDMQDRYLTDLRFEDNKGFAELSTISFFKLGV